MKASEFERAEYEKGKVEYFHPSFIKSKLGDVRVTMSIRDGKEVDQKMINLLVKLKEYFLNNDEKVLDFVFDDYKYWIEDDADGLKGVLPFDLTKENLHTAISNLDIDVRRDLTDKYGPQYEAQISFTPKWEEEHGFYMTLDGDEIERVG